MNNDTVWCVWIDENRKVVKFKEDFRAKQVIFENREIGMKRIIELVSKGYKVG